MIASMKKYLFALLLVSSLTAVADASSITGRFRSVSVPSGIITSVFSVVQDSCGFIWMGTDDGLVRYDGSGFRNYRWEMEDSLSLSNNIVNDLLWHDGYLYVGTDKGVSIYDRSSDTFRVMPGTGDRHVKGFLYDDGNLYIATTMGLMKYSDGRIETVAEGHFTRVRKVNGTVWAASYDSIYKVGESGESVRYDFKGQIKGTDVLVLDICADLSDEHALWLGLETGLVHYSFLSGKVDAEFLHNSPVKIFHYSDETLYIGTDNGLIVMEEGCVSDIYRHEARDMSSIPNNVIWSIYEDRNGNIWFGTDHGAAVADMGSLYRYIGVDGITDENGGLDVSVIKADSQGNLWLGGRNGLICADGSLDSGFWLKADDGRPGRRLSHNKVRGLHDDGERLWIISDGGLDYYHHGTGRVVNCHIAEPSGMFSSNWMYSIAEDSHGRLWIGTYDGGLYGVSKEKVIQSSGRTECDIHLSRGSTPALTSNIVRNVVVKDDVLYAETYNVINIISLDTWECRRVPLPHYLFVLSMVSCGGQVYIGTDKGLYRIDEHGELSRIPGSDIYVMSLLCDDDTIWVAGKTSLSSYSPETGQWNHSYIDEFPLLSVGTYDGSIYFGTVDGILEYTAPDMHRMDPIRNVAVTEFRLDDELIVAGKPYDGKVVLKEDIVVADVVNLASFQNSFEFSLSSFDYGVSDVKIMCRLQGFDDRWITIDDDVTRASFINVPSGNYVFEYALADSMGEPVGETGSLEVRIAAEWYATPLAWSIYVFVFIGICVAGVYYWRMKHMLAFEHAERERAISMADSKTEFLANISHEFKSPLSIILNMVSRMTSMEADSLKTRELQTVQKNAEKMHILLNQMVRFNENESPDLYMPAAVSLVELAREVWDGYSQAFAEKNINARFMADDIGYIFMVDSVQMSMAFSNLLSNALKFTPANGSVLMSVTVKDESADLVYVEVKVEDTGCGMTDEELAKIFNRHYMGPSGRGMNSEGEGIGLDIVKDIVELHKGKIHVTSEHGKGSCFTISLSTFKADSFILKDAVDIDLSLHSLSRVWQHERKPIILLVEDNHDVRDFIIASLGRDYVFLTADEGGEGLEILKKEKVDLVITDISMPGMDGLAMSRTVRNNIKTAFLPIIVLTGKCDVNTQIKSFEYVDAFVSKPFDLNYLNGRIIQLLIKHEQYLSKIRQQNMLTSDTETVESSDERLLREIIDIISRHIDDTEFSVSVLARESHWSEKQIYRKVKQLTGMTITEFIRDIRLDKAAGYLAQGKLTINEVMYKVGFITASYFSKCFKAKFGVTPSEYARQDL